MERPFGSGPERAALAALLLAGTGMRLWQYFGNTSLWIDEIALAENVIRTPLAKLVSEPLALDQVAPPGFLAVLKLATMALGPTEYALRLFPLLCGIASVLLFGILARRTRPGWASVLATALFALSPSLIAYSAQAKQYSSDVLVAVAMTLSALELRASPGRRGRFPGPALAGVAAVWFSQTAVFMVAGLGVALALLAIREGKTASSPALVATLGLWGASAAGATALGLHSLSPSTADYMRHFWQPSLPRPPVVALVLLAAIVLWMRRRDAAPLLIAPAAVTLAAAAAHMYPFSGRAIAFLTPTALLAAADGAEWIVAGLAALRVPRPAGAALFAVPLAVATVLHLPVYRVEEVRPILASLVAQRQPGDVIYVYYAAERAVRFYGSRVGIAPSEATFGGCHRGAPRGYLRELDGLRGRPRVWVVSSHGIPDEVQAITGYLGSIGRRVVALEAAGAAAQLYDLSDPARLESTTSETYPVARTDPHLGCGHGPLATTPPGWQ